VIAICVVLASDVFVPEYAVERVTVWKDELVGATEYCAAKVGVPDVLEDDHTKTQCPTPVVLAGNGSNRPVLL
jgi:hypothetical protein